MPDGWDVIYYRTTDNRCPGDVFLDGCPLKVSAQLVAILDDVAETLLANSYRTGMSFP